MLAPLLPPGAEILSDVSDLLDRVRPDVVHIVTPPASHAELAARALQAGCHVYVEKPFTSTRAEAESLLQLAAQRDRLVCAGHQYLFERPNLLALEALPTIGRLTHVESYFSFKMVRRTITPSDQAKDILPHAVYPLVAQLRAGATTHDRAIEVVGVDANADGDIYALLHLGDCTGVLILTLSGRPVEQYQHLVGTNGWLRADYITGSLTRLPGPGTGLGVLFTPYRRAFQTLSGATAGFWRLIFRRTTSYPGLVILLGRFYDSIRNGAPSPLTPQSILDTVTICEHIGTALDDAERVGETAARRRVLDEEVGLPRATRGTVLVTGGTGLLGRKVVAELRWAGFGVRTINRRLPRWSVRIPGVEYVAGDLARPLDASVMNGVTLVAHCAAETAGSKSDHVRNSIDATRNIIDAAAGAGIRDFVHISSLGVLKPGRDVGGALDEQSPIDAGNLGRGPYVWGKAESEAFVRESGERLGMRVRIIRLGPLVDYAAFSAPGRLGRELGPLYVAIGARSANLSVCDIGTAARVIRSYAEDMDQAPPLLNLVEAPPPTRADLAARLRSERPDLWFFWFPGWLLRLLSPSLRLLQRFALGSSKPIDIYAAFASERYRTGLAQQAIERAGPTAVKPPLPLHHVVRV